MVPVPEYSFDYWRSPTDSTDLTCFLPNGIVIILSTQKNATLSEIKEDLWEEAAKKPRYGMLHDQSVYTFACINNMAELEEFADENRRICDIKPFAGLLKITECSSDKAAKALNTQISHLIGKGLHEFDSLKSTEVNDFRWKMRLLGEEIGRKRQSQTWEERLKYQFPPRLAPNSDIPRNIMSRLREGNFVVQIKFENTETFFTRNVHYMTIPEKLMETILNKRSITLNTKDEKTSDFVLKVVGQDEFLIGDYPLVQFKYVQEALSKDCTPTFVLVAAENVPVIEGNVYESRDALELKRPRPSSSTLTLRKKGKQVSSWNIEDKFNITITVICRLNCDPGRTVEVGVQAGLFHGGKSLCEPQKTSIKQVIRKNERECECEFNEKMVFDIEVCNVPRMARLCFVIYETTKQSKGGKSRRIKEGANKEYFINPLAWVNTTVYDFRNQLKSGAMTLYMWTYAEDIQTDDVLHPLGTVVSNPNIEHTASLTLEFDNYGKEHGIVYPRTEKLVEYARQNMQLNNDKGYDRIDVMIILENLKQLADCVTLSEMHEQERKAIWNHRYYCLQNMPDLLPKLLHCVEWNDKREIAEVTSLLSKWSSLEPEKALELLDYAYADISVRNYAVKCLYQMSDEDLSLYLLQLVQALKHENYLDCELVKFLLGRALENQKIGHYLFWHLRSEMQTASVSIRFGLILEAYCRGSQEHIRLLQRQMECLEKLKAASELVRTKKDKEKAKAALQEFLQEKHCLEATGNVLSSLDPSIRCKNIRIERCKVMDSKMRPLWVVFENADMHGDDVYIILKNGDDLRQDMLTLQMIRIMDKLWKKEGLDLRMSPYGCISTEHRVGMIEIVLNAETIANIQKEKGMFSATSAFRKGSLLAWLKDHNRTEHALNKAIEEFTLSCAGYCVATYVLGIADRHSDNIMIKRTGQLFHIDFGHILGHFKEKFGFKRERVPFVLTHDFVHVINKGKKEALEFDIFQKNCEQAFSILRRNGYLILSLCAMMISTGLPELSSEKDLNYLRETLVLDKSEDDALIHFRSKFSEALCNSWKTSLNWASHNMAKNNKQ